MTKAHKIFWRDGMFIYPQHFQQQDLYHEDLLMRQTMMQSPYNWGLASLVLDEGALQSNKIVVRQCSGVLPGGLLFDAPDKDDLPDPVDIPEGYDGKVIYLGATVDSNCGMKAALKKDISSRYYLEACEVEDFHSGTGGKEVSIAKLNINLLREDEYDERFLVLPILRILTASNGAYLDHSHVPPCLRVGASAALQEYISQVLGLLTQYLKLSAPLTAQGMNSQSVSKVESMLILQTISRYQHLFKFLSSEKALTPCALLQHAVSLLGSLIIFTKGFNADALQIVYQHTRIAESFQPVLQLLTTVINALSSFISRQITLTLIDNSYQARFDKQVGLKEFDLILGIEFVDSRAYREHSKIFSSIKLAAIEEIKNIVLLQVAGLEFSVLNVLPSYVAYNDKTLYLKVRQEGPFWAKVEENLSIAVYLGAKFRGVNKVRIWMIPNQSED